mmetsp:Transcript_39055/g.110787  ORF Transcript_39055/g.110787 Transcript_39055/m.110787 type:complete len:205 (-) Transcript_39055:106-720(-)
MWNVACCQQSPGGPDALPIEAQDASTAVEEAGVIEPGTMFKALLRSSAYAPLGFLFEEVPHLDILVITQLVGEVADDRVRSGDNILSVNGKTGGDCMRELLDGQEQVEATLVRQAVFRISVSRGDRRLGLELQHAPSGAALFIGEVEADGAVAAAGAELKPGDRLVAVSGLTTRVAMMEVLANSDAPELTVSRAPRPSGAALDP